MALTDEGLVPVPGLLSRHVRLGSGAKAHYVTSGETGPAVVLLHGGILGSSGTAGWRFTAPFLGASGFRVYCPDFPGFGLCDLNEEHWPAGLESLVDFVQEFTTALGLDRFYLAGNSMGCVTAVNYLCAHPERVTAVALIAGFFGDVVPPQTLNPKPLLAFDGTEASMRAMLDAIVYRREEITDDLVAMRTAAANRTRAAYARIPASMMAYVTGSGADPNIAARLRTRGRLDHLTIPAICLFGRQDVVTPVELGYAQEDALPNIQFFYPDDCGHQGQTDQPEMFNQVLLEFFRDGQVSRETADWAGVSDRRPELAHVVGPAAAVASAW